MPGTPDAIDSTMERASALLLATRYFECERMCLRALGLAVRLKDWDRLARVCMPLQECRRLIRQQAMDAAAGGSIHVISSAGEFSAKSGAGFYLVQPPLIGADARRMRELLWHRSVPCLVLAREPMTRAGLWPVVAVGERSYRAQVRPPEGVVWTGQGVRRDGALAGASGVPGVAWFVSSGEALGDAAFATVDPSLPAAWRVEDILRALGAFPDHEKLHQHLEAACRAAMREPAPAEPRPRVDPFPTSF